MLKEAHPTKNLQNFIKSIIETKSKEEEDKIIRTTLEDLRKNINQKNIADSKKIEYALKAIYSDMLGQNVEFTHVFAIKLIEHKNIKVKRIGYLACSLLLEQNSDFKILLVASILRDLESKSELEIVAALNALNKLITDSFASAFVEVVSTLLSHKNPLIVKKALVTLQKIESVQPNIIPSYSEKIKKCLGSSVPMVVNAALNTILDESKKNKEVFIPLLKTLISIQKQILDKKMNYYSYQKIPEPFSQIKILRIIRNLVQNDKKLSEEVHLILEKTLLRADNLNTDVSHAIVFETVLTITKIFPDKRLLDQASSSISKFLNPSLNNSNMVYLGIIALRHITEVESKYIQQHQLFVVNNLESPDESIKRITLDLLYNNTNANNLEIISSKLLKSLKTTNDFHFKENLTRKIFNLAERYAFSIQWFIEKINCLLQDSSSYFDDQMLNSSIKILDENFKDDESIGEFLVQNYLQFLNQQIIPDVQAKLVAWILGNVGQQIYEPDSPGFNNIVEALTYLHSKKYEDDYTNCWILDAFYKVANKDEKTRKRIEELISSDASSKNEEIRLKTHELNTLFYSPLDCQENDFEEDSDMTFLYDFMNSKGGEFYDKEVSERYNYIERETRNEGLRFTHEEVQNTEYGLGSEDVVLQGSNNNKWTESGYLDNKNLMPVSNNKNKNKKKASMFDDMVTKKKKEPVKIEEVKVEEEEEEVIVVDNKNKKLAENMFGTMNNNDDMFNFGNNSTGNKWVMEEEKPKEKTVNVGNDLDLLDDLDFLGNDSTPQTTTTTTTTNINNKTFEAFVITEEGFEEQWEQLPNEEDGVCKVSSVNRVSDIKPFFDKIGFHFVSQIDEDFIFSAKLNGSIILMYVNLGDNAEIDYMVKSDNNSVMKRAIKELK